MDYELERLLVNVLFILLPIFVFQMFWVDKDKVNTELNKPAFAIMLSISIILCMSFPIEFFPGFMFDLRQVPFIIGALYGGYYFSSWLFITIIAYRFFLGGEGVYVNFFVVSIISICVPLLFEWYKKIKLDKKILLSITIAVLSSIFTIFLSHFVSQNPIEYKTISFNYFIIQGLSMGLVVYLVETMKYNNLVRKELIKAEKMSILTQISASISHEVKNPITISQGFIEALEDEDNKEKRREYIGYALEELKRAQNIIYEFLALTKPELDSMKSINISQELFYSVNVMKPFAKSRSVQIEVEEIEDNCMILGDRQKIRQCFINLIKNSIEAMETGGVLRIKALKNSNKIHIDIVDNGVGMTPNEIKRLGTPYFTTKEKGTGLGMMIVFNFIKKMDGDIEIESQKGKGTHFKISFPLLKFQPQ
ncbi:ATP-binding protein [Calidifontibacillus oryziterrae]|uniref:ATP-binding protein n=1 Tax=Calidifontibacillus oryziterrae TaxID=1191699 RepID=UPI00031A49BF|nr:sensor histidine kinase [Calidifontibacillus oryziterrae]